MSVRRSIVNMLFGVATIPTSFLIGFAAIAGTCWLALLGEWGILWSGFLLAASGMVTLYLAMRPGFFVVDTLARISKNSKLIAYMTFFIGLVLLCVVASVWSGYVFKHLVDMAKPASTVASLFIAYAAAICPWSEIVARDDNASSKLFVYSIGLCCTALLAISLMAQQTYLQYVIIMAITVFPTYLLLHLCWHFGDCEERFNREIKFRRALGQA